MTCSAISLPPPRRTSAAHAPRPARGSGDLDGKSRLATRPGAPRPRSEAHGRRRPEPPPQRRTRSRARIRPFRLKRRWFRRNLRRRRYEPSCLHNMQSFHAIIPMHHKHRKTLSAGFQDPVSGTIEWEAIEGLLVASGARVVEGRGSRVRFENDGAVETFHRPHPAKETKRYQVRAARTFLERTGVKPWPTPSTTDKSKGTDQNPGIHLYTHERVRPEAYGARAVQLTWAQPRPEISAAWARADNRAA